MARSGQANPYRSFHAAKPNVVVTALVLATALAGCSGCAHVGRLKLHHPELAVRATPVHALFGPDTLIGFQPGTGDSSKRYLGRLRNGYTADTLNIVLMGDNRPGYRMSRLNGEFAVIQKGLSLNPVRIGKALIMIPYAFVKAIVPDLGLFRDIPGIVNANPTWGREHQVLAATMAKLDTLKAQGRTVAAVINTGDLVYDGRNPANWERFLRIARPLYTRAPYFAVAGNQARMRF